MISKACPHCAKPVRVDPEMFKSDDDEMIEYCPACGGEVLVRRRAVRFDYTLEKA